MFFTKFANLKAVVTSRKSKAIIPDQWRSRVAVTSSIDGVFNPPDVLINIDCKEKISIYRIVFKF
jgi:hypothetical protein